MNENSRIRMKMSIANELLTTSGKAIRTAMPIPSHIRPRVLTPVIALYPRGLWV